MAARPPSGPIISQPGKRVGVEAQQVLTDGFEMLLAALKLLRYGVDVAEAALERVLLENRGRAGGVVGRVDDLSAWWMAKVEARRIVIRWSRVRWPDRSTSAVISSSDP